MKKEKPLLNTTERDIIKFIDGKIGSVTVNEVSNELGISYATAKKYLDKLAKENILEIDKDDI